MEQHKKRTPGGWSLQTFGSGACAQEQQQSYITTLCPGTQALSCQGGGDSSMTGWVIALIVLGACTATSWIFRVIELIEGR